MDNKKHLCFYSSKCPWSKAFISELSQTSYKKDFQFMCVDPPIQFKVPSWLKKVPALVIQGEGEPRVDGEVMNWLYEQKMQNQSNISKPNSDDLDGWNSMEHSSFAKGVGYSFNDSDTSTQGNGGSTIPGAFEFLNGANSKGDKSSQEYYPGKGEQGRTKSKKEEMFDKQMEEYQRSREAGMPQARRAM
jgi:hypothetical protein